MKFLKITICTLLFFFADRVSVSGQDLTSPPARTLLTGTSEIELTLDALGRPSVLAKINGVEMSLRVDLGANAFVLSEEAVAKLGLSPQNIDIGGQTFPMVPVNEIRIGDAVFSEMTAGVVGFLSGYGDGLIGYPTFRDLLVSFDFPDKKLILQQGELPETDNNTVLDWMGDDPGGRPDVRFSLGRLSGSAVLDTQGDGWLKMPDSLMADYSITGNIDSLNGFGPTLGEMMIQRARVNGQMMVGGYVINNPIIDFRDKPGLVIGADFLNLFTITLDQKNKRIRLIKPGSNSIDVPEEDWETRPEKTPAEPLPASNSEQYTGTYGNRDIILENGELYLQRNDANSLTVNPNQRVSAPKLLLVKEEADLFHLDRIPAVKVKFVRNSSGAIAELHLLNTQGEWEVNKKEN